MLQDLLYYSLDYFLLDVERRERRFTTVVRGTPETIDKIIATRNIGEVPEPRDSVPCKRPPGSKPLADLIETEGFTAEVLHMACFVGFLALKSGVVNIEDVLGDVGLIHEIAHNLDIGEGDPCIASRAEVVRMARSIEWAIPGYPLTPSTFRP